MDVTGSMDRLYVHNDDVFKTDCYSGLDGVPVYGIDRKSVEARHTAEIRANVARSNERRLKEMGL